MCILTYVLIKKSIQNLKTSNGFWDYLPKPFFVLAPMADVTDPTFRQIVAKYGKPDVMYTEFVSSDGLMHPDAKERLKLDLDYKENERPIVAQLFSSKPEKMEGSARLAKDLGFDGIDINMGCPDRTIEKQVSGATLINHPELAKELIVAAKAGAGGLPVSVKTRIGYYEESEFSIWLSHLIEAKPVAITMHFRTRKEMSKVPAHWEHAKEFAQKVGSAGIFTVGNGDVNNLSEAKVRAKVSGVDGVMIGRGIYGNPYLFAGRSREEVPIQVRVRIMTEHAYLFEEYWKGRKNFAVMKKFFKSYISGHTSIKEFQKELMGARNAYEVEEVAKKYISV